MFLPQLLSKCFLCVSFVRTFEVALLTYYVHDDDWRLAG